jgi:RsiW-degrading membrane proteinase PrsW (M82 family)
LLATNTIISLLLSFLPVIVFLIGLILIDSYKLVPLRLILTAILVGCVVLFACMWINSFLMRSLNIPIGVYSRYLAPITEEFFKAAFLVYLIKRKRIGFMVDASIYGFAVGAGFAILENLVYFKRLEDTNLILWIIRGFGTAIMHGGVTGIMGIVSAYYASRYGSDRWVVYLPGLVLAVFIHSVFNHFILPPQLSPLVLLTVLSIMVAVVFRASEKGTRDWLGVRFDTDAELLEMINTGKTTESRIGEYLKSLQTRFPGEVVADMLCMLRLHLELSVRAKGIMLMREAGFKVQPDPDVEERLIELKYLDKSIGKTGRLAVSPILNMSDKDLWQLHMLGRR